MSAERDLKFPVFKQSFPHFKSKTEVFRPHKPRDFISQDLLSFSLFFSLVAKYSTTRASGRGIDL